MDVNPGCCIGFLESSPESKHLVYVDGRAQSVSSGQITTMTSLMDLFAILRQRKDSPEATMSSFERVRLARQLATAVLQFHATPWLKGSWRSSDVFLYGIDPKTFQAIAEVNEPYLDVLVKGPRCAITRTPTLPSRTLIRNPFLFGLGVMLLELVHQAPLRTLQKPIDIDINEDSNTEYYIADRVRLGSSRLLGGRYAEVARKCVQCDFGRGSDLNDVAFQEVFYREVVEELEGLEAKLRELDLGGCGGFRVTCP